MRKYPAIKGERKEDMDRKEWTERERMYACWLCNFPGINNRQQRQLMETCGSMEGIYLADTKIWETVLSRKQVENLKAYTAAWRPEEEYRKMQEEGIGLVTIKDQTYPKALKEIPDPPCALFFRGRLPRENVPAVAVVGARECSEYGKYVAKQLGRLLGRNGIAVISGMAKGIDGICQRAALEAGGYSVGVLGSGVDICYPAQNKDLYENLTVNGAVLSAYPLGTPAHSWNFPPRNRIVSGLADAVVVVEARARSGTLITVDMALEQGREVYVVPGRVTDRLSDGCNRLIRQGAGVLADPEEFLEEIGQLREKKRSLEESGRQISEKRRGKGSGERTERKETEKGAKGRFEEEETPFSPELSAVYRVLDFTPKSTGEIQRELSSEQEAKTVAASLMRLVIENYAVQVSPGHFCRRGG